jgi:hypothetical protein
MLPKHKVFGDLPAAAAAAAAALASSSTSTTNMAAATFFAMLLSLTGKLEAAAANGDECYIHAASQKGKKEGIIISLDSDQKINKYVYHTRSTQR